MNATTQPSAPSFAAPLDVDERGFPTDEALKYILDKVAAHYGIEYEPALTRNDATRFAQDVTMYIAHQYFTVGRIKTRMAGRIGTFFDCGDDVVMYARDRIDWRISGHTNIALRRNLLKDLPVILQTLGIPQERVDIFRNESAASAPKEAAPATPRDPPTPPTDAVGRPKLWGQRSGPRRGCRGAPRLI
jgi:hypothetical protein